MSDVKAKQEQLVKEMSEFFDWEERFEHICDLGKAFGKDFPDDKRCDEFLVKGCTSQVWLVPEWREGKIAFLADSDSVFVRGLLALVMQVYSGQEASDILAQPTDFLKEAGLLSHLSPNRANGLASVVAKIQSYASALQNS